jgi:hypothetical protein
VTYVADPSGAVPLGLLLCDMVNIDQTRQMINEQKNEVQKGSKVTLLTDGWVVTNYIYPSLTPTAGQACYLGHSGYIHTTATEGGGHSPIMGRFLSTKDEDGYAKVYVKFPAVAIS